jgi:GNAT superfamily N-acetyltransferase
MQIRAVNAEEWPRIRPFFQAIIEAGETYAFPTDLSSQEGRELWMERPPGLTVVAVEGDSVLGSAKMGPNRPGRGSHIATASFMVDPAHRGHGTGRALGEYVLNWARAQGFRGIQFNAVVETNTAAVRLWTALGFEIIGTVPGAFEHPRHGFVGLHVMFQSLCGSTS